MMLWIDGKPGGKDAPCYPHVKDHSHPDHVFDWLYITQSKREEVHQCRCGAGYIMNRVTGAIY